jgi:hemolysin III
MQPPNPIYPFIFRTPVSASTHLLWCVLGVYVTALLWRLCRGDRVRQLSLGCFGLSMTLLYGASGFYHAFPDIPPYLDYFRLIDHSAIYVLIAGTYTPVCAVLLRGRLRTGLLVMIWTLAAVGIACKWLLPTPPYWVTAGLYVAMGWTGMIPVVQLIKAVGYRGMAWSLLGGILYTAGAVFDVIKWPIPWPHVVGHHEVLHLCDMAATAIHIYFLLCFVLPYRAEDVVASEPSYQSESTAVYSREALAAGRYQSPPLPSGAAE